MLMFRADVSDCYTVPASRNHLDKAFFKSSNVANVSPTIKDIVIF